MGEDMWKPLAENASVRRWCEFCWVRKPKSRLTRAMAHRSCRMPLMVAMWRRWNDAQHFVKHTYISTHMYCIILYYIVLYSIMLCYVWVTLQYITSHYIILHTQMIYCMYIYITIYIYIHIFELKYMYIYIYAYVYIYI